MVVKTNTILIKIKSQLKFKCFITKFEIIKSEPFYYSLTEVSYWSEFV